MVRIQHFCFLVCEIFARFVALMGPDLCEEAQVAADDAWSGERCFSVVREPRSAGTQHQR